MIRLCPDLPLPPYSYVPGHFPHPISDPAGHSYQHSATSSDEQTPGAHPQICLQSDWRKLPNYLFGIDLFNHGFYWEAHETWEQVWIELGRAGREADFIKGLIKLAAAGVKVREGRAIGVQRHAIRARELLLQVSGSLSDHENADHFGGLDLSFLMMAAEVIARDAMDLVNRSNNPLTSVLPLVMSTTAQSQKN